LSKSSSNEGWGKGRQQLIGIIDDDAGVRVAFARLLNDVGYETVAFTSADEYLFLGSPTTDCLIVDINMPGLNGLEFTRAAVANGLRAPVIIVSVDVDDAVARAATEAGAVAAVPKKAVGTQLLETIARILQRRR
jgi:FixJ family two-component response regulator